MKKIELTQGKFAIVDDENYEWLSKWKWTFDRGYARRNDSGKKIYMHRLINNTPDNLITDHKDRNGLNNRKNNLRTTSKTQNLFNTSLFSHNKSGFKGVSWDKFNKKWRASIQFRKKSFCLGLFSDIGLALSARKNAEVKYYAKE